MDYGPQLVQIWWPEHGCLWHLPGFWATIRPAEVQQMVDIARAPDLVQLEAFKYYLEWYGGIEFDNRLCLNEFQGTLGPRQRYALYWMSFQCKWAGGLSLSQNIFFCFTTSNIKQNKTTNRHVHKWLKVAVVHFLATGGQLNKVWPQHLHIVTL